MLLSSVFKAASLDGHGLSGSRPLRDFILEILYASLENKFFFFILFLFYMCRFYYLLPDINKFDLMI